MNGAAGIIHQCEILAIERDSGVREGASACGGATLEVSLFYSNRLRENGGFEYATSKAIFEASEGGAPSLGRSRLDVFDGKRCVGCSCAGE